MKRVIRTVLISIVILILFRGFIFRVAVKYKEVGTRQEIEITNTDLVEIIENKSPDETMTLKEIVKVADEITKEALKFTLNDVPNDPNKLINSGEANCVGYSAMFNSIANYLIRKYELQNEIKAEHKVGQLELFGFDLHQYFESPFFKDHDFNEVSDKKSDRSIFIDPSVSDYLSINRITKKE